MLNARSPTVAWASMSLVSATLSFFLAIVTYQAIDHMVHDLILHKWPQEDYSSLTAPKPDMVFWRGMILLGFWAQTVLWMLLSRKSPLHLKAQGTVWGQILGFASLFFFGDVASSKAFRHSPWNILLVLLMFYVAFFILAVITLQIRKLLYMRGWFSDEELDRWNEQCKDTSIDCLSICTAFLIVFMIRFVIHGKIPTIDGQFGHHSGHEENLILVCGLFFVLLAAFTTKVQHLLESSNTVKFLSTTMSIAAAFCFIFWGKWIMGSMMTMYFVLGYIWVAITMTFFVISMTFFLVLLVSRWGGKEAAFKGAISGMGLAMGWCMEKVWDGAMTGITHTFPQHDPFPVLIYATIIVMVFPIWMVYVLPWTDKSLEDFMSKHMKTGWLPWKAFQYNGAELDEDVADVKK